MDDLLLNRSVTSHPPWGRERHPHNGSSSSRKISGMMASLLSPNPYPHPYPHHNNASSAHELSTLAADVTQCVFNATLNSTLCGGGGGGLLNDSALLHGNSTFDAAAGNVTHNDTGSPDLLTPAHSMWLTIFLGVLAAVVSIVTVLGNVTVLLAFGLERSIRQPTNYFIASLAVSDLLIGTFSMPLFTQYLLLSYWPLGPWLCDLWLSLDWTVCLTSQYTVFFITMDRFLSVKIPAKYRNWRTERKVLVMVAITWVLPAVVFFTSIIGWQYFVGERTVSPKVCEVQFMSDPLFTFLLTLGYYWITLIVMCVLYAGIYKVALELQRKSDAKQRKLESTMELAAERRGTATRGPSSSNSGAGGGDGERTGTKMGSYLRSKLQRQTKKSLKANDAAGDSTGLKASSQNNVPRNQRTTSTTSFSRHGHNLGPGDVTPRHGSLGGGSIATDVGDDKQDEDRSSSPAFASDDEGSSSGATPGSKSPKPPANTSTGGSPFGSSNHHHHHRRSTKSSLNPKAGIAGIVNTAMLTTPESFRTTLMDTALLGDSGGGIGGVGGVCGVGGGGGGGGGGGLPGGRKADLVDNGVTADPVSGGGGVSPGLVDSSASSGFVDSTAPPAELEETAPSPPPVAVTAVVSSIAGQPPPAYSEVCFSEYGGKGGGGFNVGGGGGFGNPMPPSGPSLRPSHGGPNYSCLETLLDSSAETDPGEQSEDPCFRPLLDPDDLQGCPYIDETSFLQLGVETADVHVGGGGSGGGGDVLSPRLASANDGGVHGQQHQHHHQQQQPSGERESPLWKRRNSLPLPPLGSDIFDIVLDDDFTTTTTGLGTTDITSLALTSKLNGGREVVPMEDDEDDEDDDDLHHHPHRYHHHYKHHSPGGDPQFDAESPLRHPHADDSAETDSQQLSEPRRSRGGAGGAGIGIKGDGRIHSFVKSVRSRNSRRRNRRERKSKSENRARKALRTITIILGAFVLCWTPYHIMLFVIAMCKGYHCINLGFYYFTYWLCYLNSPINPFCYAFANAQFKRTFLRILRFDWHRT